MSRVSADWFASSIAARSVQLPGGGFAAAAARRFVGLVADAVDFVDAGPGAGWARRPDQEAGEQRQREDEDTSERRPQGRIVNFRFVAAPTLPALSVARTLNTCLPGFSFL